MTNRSKLLVLVAFTAIAAMLNGCDNTNGEPSDAFRPGDFGGERESDRDVPPLCDYGMKPCMDACIAQDEQCAIAEMEPEDAAGALDLVLTPDDGTDYCDDADAWGCPGMPCVHGSCWDGAGWVLDACEGVVVCDGETVDPGTCAL